MRALPNPRPGSVKESITAHNFATKRDQRRVNLRDGTANLEPIPQLNLPNMGKFVHSRISSLFDARGIVDPCALLPQPITAQMPKRC